MFKVSRCNIFTGEWFSSDVWTEFAHNYQAGYNDCIRETLRYMTDVEGVHVDDDRCTRILVYLQNRRRLEETHERDRNSLGTDQVLRVNPIHRIDTSNLGPNSNSSEVRTGQQELSIQTYMTKSENVNKNANNLPTGHSINRDSFSTFHFSNKHHSNMKSGKAASYSTRYSPYLLLQSSRPNIAMPIATISPTASAFAQGVRDNYQPNKFGNFPNSLHFGSK